MAEKRKILDDTNPGFFANMNDSMKLAVRLITDSRVPFFLKLIPVGAVAYLIIPDLIPFIIDDALVIGAGTYFFFEMCPQDVVQEHRDAIRSARMGEIDEDNIIDGTFNETKE